MPKRILIVFFAFLLGVVGTVLLTPRQQALASNVYISAAHLGEIKGYTRVYVDSSRDVAYYIADEKTLSIVSPQQVNIEGLDDCRIISSTEGAFIVETRSPSNITDGLSGVRVYSKDGEVLGFVVSLKSTGQLECRTDE